MTPLSLQIFRARYGKPIKSDILSPQSTLRRTRIARRCRELITKIVKQRLVEERIGVTCLDQRVIEALPQQRRLEEHVRPVFIRWLASKGK